MAKAPRTTTLKDENTKKYSPNVDKYAKLKYLSKWLFNPTENIEPLVEDKIEFGKSLKFRLFNQLLNNPKACYYLNTYLNGFYDFVDVQYTPEDWLHTFATIIRLSNIKSFHITKFQSLKRDQFTTLLKNYAISIGDMPFNNSEINNLFSLFEHNIIKSDNLDDIQTMTSDKLIKINDKEPKKSSMFISSGDSLNNPSATPEIIDLCNKINTNISNRPQCRSCPGFKRRNLIIEGLKYQDVDVLILGAYATPSDIQAQTFLSSVQGIKTHLNNIFISNRVSYIYSNTILCEPTSTEDPTIKRMGDSCNGLTTLIQGIIKPKLKVVIGTKCAKLLGIKSPVKQLGTLVNNEYFLLPDLADLDINNKKTSDTLEIYFKNLETLIGYKSRDWATLNPIDSDTNSQLMDNSLILSKRQSDFTLFDIQVINGRAMYIMIDSNGKKHFVHEDVKHPVFIKNGKFSECNFTDTDMDYVAYLTVYDKQSLSQKLNENLKRDILKNKATAEDTDFNNNDEYQNVF